MADLNPREHSPAGSEITDEADEPLYHERVISILGLVLDTLKTGDTERILDAAAVYEAAVMLEEAASAQLDAGTPDLDALHAAGWLFWLRYQALPEGEDQNALLAAVRLLHPVFVADSDRVPGDLGDYYLSPDSPAYRPGDPAGYDPVRWTSRALDLYTWYEQTGDMQALEETLLLLRAAVGAMPAGHPNNLTALANLGAGLHSLAELTGSDEALAEAVTVARAAVGATPVTDPARPMRLSTLGGSLATLFQRTGEDEAIREAAAVLREAAVTTSADDPWRALCLSNSCAVLRLMFERTGDLEALRESVAVGQAAVEATAHDDPHLSARLTNLGSSLNSLYRLTAESDALIRAVAAQRAAVAATPDGHPDLATHLNNLAAALMSDFERSGELSALREAVAMSRAAKSANPGDHPDHAAYLSNLGAMLRVLFEHTGDLEALSEAADVSQEAVSATPGMDPDLSDRLCNLGNSLRCLFDYTGDLDTVAEAIGALRAAIAAAPDDHPGQGGYLAALSAVLRAQYERTADLTALREAVAVARAAMEHPHDPGDMVRQVNFAIASHTLYQRTHDSDALTAAISAFRASVEATTGDHHPSHSDHAKFLSNLSMALGDHYEETRDPATLDEAINAARSAVAATPDDHPHKPGFLNTLANALHAAFGRDDADTAILGESIRTARAAVAVTPEYSADKAGYLCNLGGSLLDLFRSTGDVEALQEARTVLATALNSPYGLISERIHAGQLEAWGNSLSGDAPAALAAMETVARLLPLAATRELHQESRQYRLGEAAGISDQAAAAALAAGQPERAVALLEQTRALILGEMMGIRADLARLCAIAPDLGQAFREISDRLAAPASSGPAATSEPWREQQHALRARAEQRRRSLAEWGTLLDRIREHPGLADFLVPPQVSQLSKQAAAGPIVMVSSWHGHGNALIITPDPDHPVLHVPLPALGRGSVEEQTRRFRQARLAAATSPSTATCQEAEATLETILGWLWDAAAGPVLNALQITTHPTSDEEWPRLWWCPVGPLAYLPLHAAGHHGDALAGTAQPRTVLDRVVSSYTSTVRALAYARREPPSEPAGTKPLLIIAMPDTPGARRLPGVNDETRDLNKLVPSATVLQGQDATCKTVLAALTHHSVAHFACHGVSTWDDPGSSYLVLHDHQESPLTVTAIAQLDLDHADLAYLSACSTADPGPHLADEALHITSAFQVAGYRSIIGTLWPVLDSPETAVSVYTHLTSKGSHSPDTTRTAAALHHAITRDRNNSAPIADWAAYIHVGI
jgi:hypothetical protein